MKLSILASALLVLTLNSSSTQAQMLGLSFQRITTNASIDISAQLSAQVRDREQALSDFSNFTDQDSLSSITDNEVLFTFSNNTDLGSISNIGEIYFDDGTIFSQTRINNSLGGFTKYTDGGKNGVNPDDLPGGNSMSPTFVATADFGADTQGNPDNGVNTSDDIVGIVIQLLPDLGFTELTTALVDGTLRLGLHVRSIGGSSSSDSFVNNPFEIASAQTSTVPLPAAFWFFGPALLVLTRVVKRNAS